MDDAPLRRVRVVVQAEQVLEPVFTNEEGRFETIVPASSGGLRFTKAGYLGAALNRRDAQAAGVATVRLVKGAALNGTVSDPSGVPAVGVPVRLRRVSDAGGRGGGGQYSTDTDDLGEFRVGSLPAGRYSVSVGTQGFGGAERALFEQIVGDLGGRGNIGALADQLVNGNGQIDEAALRDAIAQQGARGRGNPQNAQDGGGRRGRGAAPEAGARGAQADAGRGAQADTGRGAQPADQGRGRGRGNRGQPTPNPSEPVIDVVAGQEASISLTYEAPATAALPQMASLANQLQAQAQAQRNGTQAANATASIRGRVLNQDGSPIRGAQVQAAAIEGTARRIDITDASGRYEVTGLVAGQYRVRATKSGLMTVEYGQSREQQPGKLISLTPGARSPSIDITIPKGSTLSGAVLDAAGEPIEGANVQVWQSRFLEGRSTLAQVTSVRSRRTDDRGRYRVYGLLPGNYYLVAENATGRGGGGGGRGGGRGGRGGPADELGTRVFFPGTPLATQATVITAEVGQDASGVDLWFNPGRASRIRGVAKSSTGEPSRGRAFLAVSQRSGAPVLPVRNTGIEADGSFEFRDVTPGEYVVQVIETGQGGRGQGGRGGGPGGDGQGAAGRGQGGGGRGGQGGGQGGNRGGGGQGGQGGRGQQAAAQTPTPQAGGGRGGARGGGAGQPGVGGQAGAGAPGARGGGQGQNPTQGGANVQAASREFGAQLVTVSEGDSASVVIDTALGVRMAGRIVLEGDANTSPASFGLTAYPADFDTAPLSGARTLRATIQDDGTFEIVDLVGAMRIGASRAPAGWWLKSVTVGGVNAAVAPADFGKGSQSTDDVTVVFATGAGGVDGRVLDDRRQPATEFNVVVFAADPDRWFSQSPYVKLGTPSQDGSYTVDALPPADYLVVAVDRIDGGTDFGEWQNPAVLSALAGSAKRLSVGQNQRVTAELRLVSLQR
jgi:protocatechuate 3,4-dioxygenase beta subunit